MIKKILLPIDHTDELSWKSSLVYAVEQAGFYGAELEVMSVIPEVIKLPNLPENYSAGAVDYVTGKIQAILDKADAGNLPIHISEGSVYREVLKFAHKGDFDLIVVASSKGDFPNYEIGPNIARIVRNAHCSVFIVRNS